MDCYFFTPFKPSSTAMIQHYQVIKATEKIEEGFDRIL